MASAYSRSTFTLAAATPTRLSDQLAVEGYTGPMIGGYLRIAPGAIADLFMGDSSAVSAGNGVPIAASSVFIRDIPPIDPGAIWLFSTGGGDISVTFIPRADMN